MVVVLNLEAILAIVTVFLFSNFRALLSCGLVICILSSGFTLIKVRIKSVLVLLYAFLSATSLRTIVYYFSHIRLRSTKKIIELMYNLIETFVTYLAAGLV